MNQDFDSMGIIVIPCFGKPNLDRPLVIFRHLGIPTYVVWDGDYSVSDPKPGPNRYLLRLLGQEEQDWPDEVGSASACFKVNLEETLAEEVGRDFFRELLSEAQRDLEFDNREQALKNPIIIQRIVEKAASRGRASISLKSIVKNITAIRAQIGTHP